MQIWFFLAFSILPMAILLTTLVFMEIITPITLVFGLTLGTIISITLFTPYITDWYRIVAWLRRFSLETDAPLPILKKQSGPAFQIMTAIDQARRAINRNDLKLVKQIALQETILDSLPDALLMLDRQKRILWANKAAKALFARDPRQLELTALIRDPKVLDLCQQALTSKIKTRPVDVRLPGRQGLELRVSIESIANTDAQSIAAIVILHDITDIKRSERMVSDFVANASHELRTPLASLSGFISTLKGPARHDEAARERFLGIMEEQAQRMERLIDNLLDLSRIESNEHSPPQEQADLSTILPTIAASLMPQAQARKMELRLDLADDLPLVMGAEEELMRLFQNLIENAIKYGDHGTAVDITARIDGTDIVTHIRDRSPGIPKEDIGRLTERFFRIDNARSRKTGGTGLGLAIVKHIVNRHQGSLTIDSREGEGSVFTVRLRIR